MVAVLLLFPGTGSDVADDTVAVFETSADFVTGGAVITSVIGAAGPRASVGVGQVKTPAANPQLHPAPVALTKPEPAGSASVTETDDAAGGAVFGAAGGDGAGGPAKAGGGGVAVGRGPRLGLLLGAGFVRGDHGNGEGGGGGVGKKFHPGDDRVFRGEETLALPAQPADGLRWHAPLLVGALGNRRYCRVER